MGTLDRVLTVVERLLLGSAMLSASAILFANVVLRYFFAKGLVWAEESVRYLIIWMVFVGSATAARHASHINVDVLVNLLPERVLRVVMGGIFVVAALFSGALALWGWKLVLIIKASGQVTPGLQMPTFWAYLAVPVGAAMMAVRFLQAAAVRAAGGERS